MNLLGRRDLLQLFSQVPAPAQALLSPGSYAIWRYCLDKPPSLQAPAFAKITPLGKGQVGVKMAASAMPT